MNCQFIKIAVAILKWKMKHWNNALYAIMKEDVDMLAISIILQFYHCSILLWKWTYIMSFMYFKSKEFMQFKKSIITFHAKIFLCKITFIWKLLWVWFIFKRFLGIASYGDLEKCL